MPLAALLLLASGAEPSPALADAFAGALRLTLADDNGPPPGSPYPPPPPLVQDPTVPLPPEEPRAPYPPFGPQPTPPQPMPLQRSPAPPPIGDVGVRFLWGVGLHFGGGQDQIAAVGSGSTTVGASNVTSGVGGVGLYLRVGVQLDDRWGIEGEVTGATVIVDSYVRGALTLDYTPTDLFTFAVGPVVRDDADEEPCGCAGDVTVSVTSVGGTVRFDLHPWATRTPGGRSAATFGLVADLGATTGAGGFCSTSEAYTGSGPAYAIYLTFGYVHY